MSEEREFRQQCLEEVRRQGENHLLNRLTRQWVDESIKSKYSYHFEWLGRPIIQYPQDIVGTQQLLWHVKPDLIIETGIARGGSLIFYSSILELIAQCGGPSNARVLGIDIDIREENKKALIAHPMSKRIELIQGSSVDLSVVERVREAAGDARKVLVCLDSNHTHDHVLQELRHYAPMVSMNSYLIVFDTVIEDLPSAMIKDRPWSKGNNPKTALLEYLKEIERSEYTASDGARLNFMVDRQIEQQLLITVAPSGFLLRC